MDTIRVDICYRPLRIGWVIRSDDRDAFRRSAELSHTLWGGRFNPILMADREEEASRLIDLFRIDLLLPLGESDEVKSFPKKFPHLINPFFHDSIFIGGDKERKRAQVLDVHNALVLCLTNRLAKIDLLVQGLLHGTKRTTYRPDFAY